MRIVRKREVDMDDKNFVGKANLYDSCRPEYPKVFIDYLYSDVGISSDSVVGDIGSGTGILAEKLLERGTTVYGVEPNSDMRQTAESKFKQYDNFYSVDSKAEHMPFSNDTFDFIIVGMALHFFDREKFKKECCRLLKPNGKVVLAWNNREYGTPIHNEHWAINERYCPEFGGFLSNIKYGTPEQFSDFFKNGQCDYRMFKHIFVTDKDGFFGNCLSASYAPKKGDKNYDEYIEALTKLFEAHNNNGKIQIPTAVYSYVGEMQKHIHKDETGKEIR